MILITRKITAPITAEMVAMINAATVIQVPAFTVHIGILKISSKRTRETTNKPSEMTMYISRLRDISSEAMDSIIRIKVATINVEMSPKYS